MSDQLAYILPRSQQVPADAADGPRKGQDGAGGDHGFDALADALHKGFEAHHLPGDKEQKRHQQPAEAA